jgi:EpsI family protein
VKRRAALLLVAALLVAAGGVLGELSRRVEAQHLRRPLASLPRVVDGWRAEEGDSRLDARTLEVLRPQGHLLRQYLHSSGQTCTLFAAYFGLQEQGRMIHSPRICLPGGGWQIQSRRYVTVPGGGWQVNHLLLSNGLEHLSVVYWYQGRGRVVANEYLDRLRLLADGLWLGRNDGALFRLTSPAPGGSRDAVLDRQLVLAAGLIPAFRRLSPPVDGE